jgi:hypothetical protein
VAGAADRRLRARAPRAAARRRNDSLEARLAHPVFEAIARWQHLRSLEELNAAAAGIRTQSGHAIRFVPPSAAPPPYELKVFETGRIETRPDNLHDWFNALCWLAFPLTKAQMNAMHAAEIPREGGRRGRLRDLLTILDEGGAVVLCSQPELVSLLKAGRWKDVFWQQRESTARSMRVVVLGHAVLEQALSPRPGVTCKVLFGPAAASADAVAAQWLTHVQRDASPRDLAPLPIFGFPGWLPEQDAAFYDDGRFFRPQSAAK